MIDLFRSDLSMWIKGSDCYCYSNQIMHVDTWANCISRFHHQFSFPSEVPHYMTLQYVTMQYHRLTLGKKKPAFFRFTFTFVFAIPAESSGGQFLMFKPTVFSKPFKIQTFSLNSNYFFVVVGNSFAQLYSSSSFMLYILWIFKGIFKKTFSWIHCFDWRGIFFYQLEQSDIEFTTLCW